MNIANIKGGNLVKMILFFALAFTLLLCMTACGNSGEVAAPTPSIAPSQAPADQRLEPVQTPASEPMATEEPSIETQAPAATPEDDGRAALVVYFSWSGNTKSVANEIAAQTGADIFRIVPASPYTEDYDTLLDVAQAEQANDARPAILETVGNFDGYDVVYIGFPNWWGDMPMILYTFLDEYDFSGKTIAPFVTSGGSGFSGSIKTIGSMEPAAVLTKGLSLGSSQASSPAGAVAKWLSEIGLAKEE